MRSGHFAALVILLACVLLVGCQRGTGDLRQWVDSERQRPGQPIEPIPPAVVAEVVAYEAFDMRDPFQRRSARAEEDALAEASESGDGPRPDFARRREFLEGFPLDTLSMVGTLQIEGIDFALIRDNENVIHRVRAGEFMGRNHGQVERVTANRVELRELIQEREGVWAERRVQISMGELQ